LDFEMLVTLAFAMGLMNATIATSTALSVRTTHMTGPATDLGVHLGTALYATGAERAEALKMAALRGGKLASFILGGAVVALGMNSLGHLSLMMPAAAILWSTLQLYATSEGRTVATQPVLQGGSR
jgi:uncharacterized membrane protein YoaK (UPF0700 family)